MTIPILVEPSQVGFRATTGGPLELSAEAASAAEAVSALQEKIAHRLERGAILIDYIQTADRLTRTSVWLEKMEGGIDFLREVIIDDRLGISDELERQLQSLVDTYECEWKAVVDDPEKRRFFQQFANTDLAEPGVELVTERGQQRPADWPAAFVPLDQLSRPRAPVPDVATESGSSHWVRVGHVSDFPVEGGRAVKYGRSQIAVFRFPSRNKWYACENRCPHKREMVLARGILGDQTGTPKVACPLHKKTFSLESEVCLSGEDYKVRVFPVKVEQDAVLLALPPEEGFQGPIWVEDNACVTQCAVPCG